MGIGGLLTKLISTLLGERVSKDVHLMSIIRVGLLVLACMALNTLSFYFLETRHYRKINEEPPTLFDSIWYSATTITTVGYGDISPKSVSARVCTIFLMYCVGVASLPYFISHIVSYTVARKEKEEAGMLPNEAEGGLIIVNIPGENWLLTLLRELRSEPSLKDIPICIVDSVLEKLPAREELADVHFVRGNTIDRATYERANVAKARFVIVLPRDPSLPDSDGTTHTIIGVVEKLTEARIIPICLDGRNEHLFEGSRSLVFADFAVKVAVQEMSDPWVSRTMDKLVKNTEGCTPFSFEVKDLVGRTIREIEVGLMRLRQTDPDDPRAAKAYKLLAVTRDGEPDWMPKLDEKVVVGDVLILVGANRFAEADWEELEHEILRAIDEEARA